MTTVPPNVAREALDDDSTPPRQKLAYARYLKNYYTDRLLVANKATRELSEIKEAKMRVYNEQISRMDRLIVELEESLK